MLCYGVTIKHRDNFILPYFYTECLHMLKNKGSQDTQRQGASLDNLRTSQTFISKTSSLRKCTNKVKILYQSEV
jgi:hypothetical protein